MALGWKTLSTFWAIAEALICATFPHPTGTPGQAARFCKPSPNCPTEGSVQNFLYLMWADMQGYLDFPAGVI